MKTIEGGITAALGFKAAGIHCGIKKEKLDLALILSDTPARVAIAYTRNKVRAAPILVMMDKDPEFLQAFVANSGNANALTGSKGMEDAQAMVAKTSEELGIHRDLVGVASTGVIGRYLPMDRLTFGIPEAVRSLGKGTEHDDNSASAIMTTDTMKKQAACKVTLECGTIVTIGGMAKGSGMISPAMKALHATTLSFVTTDALLTKRADAKWQQALDRSFNMINVDGDQSTNDISVLMANGAAGGQAADDDPNFWEGVEHVLRILAKMIVMDGEGATKLIEVNVMGAASESDARLAAKAVVSSNLVKAAMFGADPNFGRILAAIGNSGCEFDLNRVQLTMASNGTSTPLFDRGVPLTLSDSKVESAARKIMGGKKITIKLNLGVGDSAAEAWGCDLSYDYVKINAQYTT
ncbi:MAG: bifunctional ornithine acetyltransferase/N-acetylglutamate synthase [Methanomassiliicoccales archaeon]|jgi:glutamate N-acetyltransferase/amino-acid N-acetyltransferase